MTKPTSTTTNQQQRNNSDYEEDEEEPIESDDDENDDLDLDYDNNDDQENRELINPSENLFQHSKTSLATKKQTFGAINKSASTSSIHLAHIATPPKRSSDLESMNHSHKQTLIMPPKTNSFNPPVSNRSQVKNQSLQLDNFKLNKSLLGNHKITKSCHHSSTHSVHSSSSNNSNSPLNNKNLQKNHLINKSLTKSPCSVNSLSTSNKHHLLLTKESPKKQKSKVQRILHNQPKKNNEILLFNNNNSTVKPEFDVSKRKYLVGLNLFNRKPDKGIYYDYFNALNTKTPFFREN